MPDLISVFSEILDISKVNTLISKLLHLHFQNAFNGDFGTVEKSIFWPLEILRWKISPSLWVSEEVNHWSLVSFKYDGFSFSVKSLHTSIFYWWLSSPAECISAFQVCETPERSDLAVKRRIFLFTLQVLILQISTFAGQRFPVSCSCSSSFSCILLLHSSIGAVHISTPRRGCLSISTMIWDSRKAKSAVCSCGEPGLAWSEEAQPFWLYLQELEKWIMVHSLALSSACVHALQLADFPPKQSGYIQMACEEWCLAMLVP